MTSVSETGGRPGHPSVVHATFAIARSYPQPPARVFAAFADPVLKRRWFAEGEKHEVLEFESDLRVGGVERVRYRLGPGTPFEGAVLTHDGVHQDILQDRRVLVASTMSFGDRRISASLVTVDLVPKSDGTELVCTHQGAFFEGSDGPQIREMGWRKLIDRLSAELGRG